MRPRFHSIPGCRLAAPLAAACLLLATAGHATAQGANTFTNAQDQDITNSNNWSLGTPAFNTTINDARWNINGTTTYTAAQGDTTLDVSTPGGNDRTIVVGAGSNTANGSLTISGGTLFLTPQSGVLTALIGAGANNSYAGSSEIIVNGGNLIMTTAGIGSGAEIGVLSRGTAAASGLLSITNGSVVSDVISFGSLAATQGTATINVNSGGSLSTRTILARAATPNASINFDGGTLIATGGNGEDWIRNSSGGVNVNILAGGATFDTNGRLNQLIQVPIAGNQGGNLTKTGGGELVLLTANSYDGDTFVNQGVLRIEHGQALGAAASTSVANNARLEMAGGITVNGETITIIGNGANFNGALQSVGGHNTWNGDVILGANATRIGAVGAGQSLTITGTISDGGAGHTLGIRNADGGGTTILSGQSTYGGDTHIIVGPTQLAGGADRLPTGTTLRMGNSANVASASFDLNGNDQTVGGLVSDGTSMSMVVTNSSATPATLTVNNSTGNTYNGVLGGNLALTKTGGGQLTLGGSGANANNSHTGLTTVSGGRLHLNKSGGTAIVADLLVENNSLLTFGNNTQLGPDVNVTVTGGIFNGTGVNSGQRANHTETFASLIVSGGGVFQTGNGGDWTITGAGSFTGGGGARFIGNSGSPGSTTRFDSLSLTNMNGGGAITSPNTFDLGGGTLTSVFVGPGGLSLDSSTIRLFAGTGGSRLVLDGDVTATGAVSNSVLLPNSGTVNPSLELSSTAAPAIRTFNVAPGSEFATNVSVSNGASSAAGVTITGGGIFRYSGSLANTYTGPTTLQQGTLQLNQSAGVTSIAGDLIVQGGNVTFNASNQIASSSNVTLTGGIFNGTGVNSGQRLNHTETFASLTVSGGGVFQTGNGGDWTITGAGSFTGGGGARFIGNSGSGGSTTSFGSLSLTNMNGAGAITAPNTFDVGALDLTSVFVGSGGLSLNNSNIRLATGTGGSRLILDGDVSTTGNDPTGIIALATGGGSNQRVELSSTAGSHSRSFDIGANAPLSVEVPVTDGAATTGSIVKTGDGTMTLAGNSSYTGTTTVVAGTLLIDGNNTAATGDVTVQSGATLGGNGTVGGATLINDGAVLSPGNSAGTLTFNQDLTLAPGATYSADVLFGGTTTDLVVMNPGTTLTVDGATLAGTWGGSDGNLFRGSYSPDTMFWIVDNQGSDPIGGIFANTTPAPGFAGLFDGETPHLVTIGDQLFAAFYESQFGNFSQAGLTGGNDLLLMAIPEPSRALLLAAAALGLLLRRRR